VKVLVAGATGAIGRSLVPALVRAGHDVVGTTRSPGKLAALQGLGATAELCDALDGDAVHALVARHRPEAIVNQLTDLPHSVGSRQIARGSRRTGELRRESTRILLDAAHATGTRRIVLQSIAFLYAPGGSSLCTEDDAADTGASGPWGDAVRGTVAMERMVLDDPAVSGIVLRYGQLYGPGTWYARDGALTRMARRRMYPIIGDGGGMFCWLHVDDAAAATVLAVESQATGIFNVTDDDPAPVCTWMPVFAAAIGAPPPRRMPVWLARPLAGDIAVGASTVTPAVSSARARSELGWSPRWTSWREGFTAAPS
jgi:2-alkyl-3-oxoalkanoate reductase